MRKLKIRHRQEARRRERNLKRLKMIDYLLELERGSTRPCSQQIQKFEQEKRELLLEL